MADLLTIELKGLHFFAAHGLYAEERKTGNEFEVNLTVSYIPATEVIREIEHTVDYSSLYRLLKNEMKKPRQLLETLVMEIAEIMHQLYSYIKKIDISVHKLYPPIPGFTGRVGVSYSKSF